MRDRPREHKVDFRRPVQRGERDHHIAHVDGDKKNE
jgi:hypothetical protein